MVCSHARPGAWYGTSTNVIRGYDEEDVGINEVIIQVVSMKHKSPIYERNNLDSIHQVDTEKKRTDVVSNNVPRAMKGL